jgi:AraC-like DNA-binding protein
MNNNQVLLRAPHLSNEKSLKTLIENRSIYTLNHCELNIFETYESSQLVPLEFSDFVVTSMLRGKKIMHLFDDPGFEYVPGQTVVIPSNIQMKIDFPDASKNNPTQCMALAIDSTKIAETLDFLNERYPKQNKQDYWQLNYQNYFFYNNLDLASIINKLIKECMDTSPVKDVLADLSLQELLIRIIQSQTINSVENGFKERSNSSVHEITQYIKLNLKENMSLKALSSKACMSTASFYRFFKRELGMSPIEYVLNEKIKAAKKLLQHPGIQINEVCYLSGFDDANYFSRLFKKYEGITPKQYQLLFNN